MLTVERVDGDKDRDKDNQTTQETEGQGPWGCCKHCTIRINSNKSNTMSAAGEEELLDYSDSEDVNQQQVPVSTDAAAVDGAADANGAEETDKKGSYVSIHTSGFRDFLLKSELVRAIADCGFEHPSEG
jgi:hypothetical protein